MDDNINLLSVLDSEYFKGVSWKLGERILARFTADEFLRLLEEGRGQELSAVAGISERKALSLQSGYVFAKPLLDLARYLDDRGITRRPCAKIIFAAWRHEAFEKIRSNPYRLLAVADWPEVDFLGLTRGPEFHHCRVVAAIEWCMYLDFEEGKNTAINMAPLRAMVQDLIRCSDEVFLQGLKLSMETKTILDHDGWYQLPLVCFFERALEKFLKSNTINYPKFNVIASWLDTTHTDFTQEQRKAVINAIGYKISLFYGRGGRGKTRTLKAIVDGASRLLRKKVFLCAVPARAVKRMQEATQHPTDHCFTIASLLRLRPSDLEDTMVIIDEASMLSLQDFFQIARKLALSSTLVLLGNHDQVPSIDAGRTLYDLIESKVVPSTELTVNFRQDDMTDSQLDEIINGHFPVFETYYQHAPSGLYRVLIPRAKRQFGMDPVEMIEDEVVRLYLILSRKGENVQILSPLRKHLGGCVSINNQVHRSIFGRGDLCPGTPVVWRKNKRTSIGTQLTNGSAGFVESVFPKGMSRFHLEVCFKDEGVIPLTWDETRDWLEMSYCLSVHQAAGSEWDTVIVALPPSERMIDRNIVYTAMSRSRSHTIAVYADHAFIEQRVREPSAHLKRRSLFLRGVHV